MSEEEFERNPRAAVERAVGRRERVVVERGGRPLVVVMDAADVPAEEARPPSGRAAIQQAAARTSQLGRDLAAIRERFLRSGGALLSDDEILAEVRERRGGFRGENDAADVS